MQRPLLSPLLIKEGRLMDPVTGRDETGDLFIVDGRIAEQPESLPTDTQIIDAAGLIVTPGFIDIHVHLREPGGEQAETIASGAEAAVRGGFTHVVAMPNTSPALDTPERVAFVLEQGRKAGFAHVLTTACISRDRAGGELAPLQELAAAGACAFTDDGCTVQSDDLMREAMKRAVVLDLPVMDHAQDREMELQGGVMHEGAYARKFGFPGIPIEAETRIVARDIRLAEETGCVLNIQHVSAAASVDMIQAARDRGVRVTGEATPHHLSFCDADIDPDTPEQFKMNPPLRSAADRARILEGAELGILGLFATDHAPHLAAAKAKGFVQAPFGIVGLETAIGITYALMVQSGRLSLMDWIHRWTVAPWRVLGRADTGLAPGAPGDLTLLDVATEWVVDANRFASRSRNTPFNGRRLQACAKYTIVTGKIYTKEPMR